MLKIWQERGNLKHLVGLDLDQCDNLSEDVLYKFLTRYGGNLKGLAVSGIPTVTDTLLSNVIPILKNIK